MKALIVDDEPPARRELRRLLGAIQGIDIVGEAGNIDVEVHRIIAPVTGGDHPSVKVEQAAQLNPVEGGDRTPIPRMRKRRHDAQALFALGAGARLALSCATSARSAAISASSSARRTRPGSTSSPQGVP